MLLKGYLLEGGLTSRKHENIPDSLGKSGTNPRWGYSLVAHVVFIAIFGSNSRLLADSGIMGGELQLTEVQMDASDITNVLRGIFISSDTMSIYKIQILTWVELCILIWIVSGRTADELRGEDSVYGSVMRDCADRQGEAHQ